MMRSESRTDDTSGLVTMTAVSALRMARVAPRSMPAGLSQIIQSNFERSSAMTLATPSSVSASLSRVCEAGSRFRFSNRLSRMSACGSFATPWITLIRSKTTRRSAPITRSRLRNPTSKSMTTTFSPRWASAAPSAAVDVVLPTPPLPDVMTAGKGGVGKTTSTAALGAALAHLGEKVVVIDFDVGLRNLDLVMGAERRVVFDLINVIHGVAKLPQALIRDKRLENLHLLPASQTRDKDALTEDGVAKVIAELRSKFDWIICDSPAGIERGATMAMRYADAAIIVTNPEVSSVRDSDRIIGLLDSKTEKAERGEFVDKQLLITRFHPWRAARGEMLSIDDVLEILSIPLLGIIPESEEVLRASNVGSPVTLNNPASAPARAYFDAVRRLKGETIPVQVPSESRGIFNKLFGRKAA